MSTFARYALVGVANSAVGFGTMAGLALLGAHYAAYTAAGYGLAFLSSYLLNGRFTFGTGGPSARGLGLFVMVNGLLLALVEAVQVATVELAGAPELAAVLLGAAVYLAAGFGLNRRLAGRAA